MMKRTLAIFFCCRLGKLVHEFFVCNVRTCLFRTKRASGHLDPSGYVEETVDVASLLCTIECFRDCGKHSGVGMACPISSSSSKLGFRWTFESRSVLTDAASMCTDDVDSEEES